MPVLCCRW